MISSRMEGRLAEMGVRKSFGTGRKMLLPNVMWENLLLTALGGALGLLLAWLALYVGRGVDIYGIRQLAEYGTEGGCPRIG